MVALLILPDGKTNLKKRIASRFKNIYTGSKKYELPNTVFIDNTSSKFVVEEYENLFRNNISVVTCNKISNSESYAQYLNLKHLAAKNGVSFCMKPMWELGCLL